jgi:hypothetical protein
VQVGVIGFTKGCAIPTAVAFAAFEAAMGIPAVLMVVVAGSLVDDDAQACQRCN